MGLAQATIGGLFGAIGSHEQSQAAEASANTQAAAADRATQEQQRQFDLARGDLAPYREAGYGALNRLTSASTGDMSSFQASPDYNFVRSEGNRDIGNSFAARGGAASGNALRALSQYNSNLASGEYNNWWNRQAGLAGVGQNAVNAGNVAGMNAANNISGITTNAANLIGQYGLAAGNARASGIANFNNQLQESNANTLKYAGYFFGKGGFGFGKGGGG